MTSQIGQDDSVQYRRAAKKENPSTDALEEIEDLSRRINEHPMDLRLKFELAKRLMKRKMIDEAIPLLQAAYKDVRIQGRVLVSLGMCFLAKKQYELAQRQFENALEILSVDENRLYWPHSNN